jgi:hypothetical protein
MGSETRPPEKPEPPATHADGIDVSLIRWMLSLTPRERLEFLQRHIAAVEALRIRR